MTFELLFVCNMNRVLPRIEVGEGGRHLPSGDLTILLLILLLNLLLILMLMINIEVGEGGKHLPSGDLLISFYNPPTVLLHTILKYSSSSSFPLGFPTISLFIICVLRHHALLPICTTLCFLLFNLTQLNVTNIFLLLQDNWFSDNILKRSRQKAQFYKV